MPRVIQRAAQRAIAVAFAGAVAVASHAAASTTPSAQVNANWGFAGLTEDNRNFSPLRRINDRNVQKLGLAWYADIPAKAGLVGAPIVVDGVVYQSGQLSIVYANDLRTGKLLWTFDPKVTFNGDFIPSLGARINRGVAAWKGKIFVGTGDCRLVAVDAKSGQKAWEADVCVGDSKRTIAGAPQIANGKVLIGPSNMDDGTRRGYLDAYDAETGKRLWRFYTIPGDPSKGFENKAMEMASKTWGKDYWRRTGGGSVYGLPTYDPVLNLVYFGTSSMCPDAPPDRGEGRGDELFGSSVVAVNADTGEYVWHYQETPNNAWNYDSHSTVTIADLQLNGKKRRVLLHAPKNGYFYVLDAATGKLLSADQYGVRVNWSSHIDLKTGRPVEMPDAKYWLTGKALHFPSSMGARNWMPMAFSEATGLVYVSAMDMGQVTTYTKKADASDAWAIVAGNTHFELLSGLTDGTAPLIAWDPVARKVRWRIDEPLPAGGGTMATAGNLVFYGRGDGLFRAIAADTGKVLWSATLPGAIRSTAVTVEVDGEQIVLLAIGSDGSSGFGLVGGDMATTERTRNAPARLLAFKLGGTTTLPVLDTSNAFPKPPLPRFPDDMARTGYGVLISYGCDYCHGGESLKASLSTVPDLLKISAGTHAALEQIVIGGAYKLRGMPQFSDMPKSDLQLIEAFITNVAWDAYDKQESRKKPSGAR